MKKPFCIKLRLILLLNLLLAWQSLASASVFTVKTSDDYIGGSLRAGILYANAHPGTIIRFEVPQTDPGVQRGSIELVVNDPLPEITGANTTIDGGTQPATGHSGHAGQPKVVLNGSRGATLGRLKHLLLIRTSKTTVRGISFKGVFPAIRIRGSQASGNRIEGCHVNAAIVGSQKQGTSFTAVTTGNSIVLDEGASGNVIGGTGIAARNVIAGIELLGSGTSGNRVVGNYIGVDADGKRGMGVSHAVLIRQGASRNLVGGLEVGTGNVISGCHRQIDIQDTTTAGNIVQGNFIGTDASGLAAAERNFAHATGINISGGTRDNLIGGTQPAARNVIAGNDFPGVWISQSGTSGNKVQGNYIGVGVDGKTRLGNSSGVSIEGGTHDNLVGGDEVGARNVIGGNEYSGVQAFGRNNRIQGNYIGLAADGVTPAGNSTGVTVGYGESLLVGGTTAGARNVISANRSNGVAITKGSNCTVQGNYIGTDATGVLALGNGHAGVSVYEGSSNNIIGGTSTAARNVVAANARYGVLLTDKDTQSNKVQGNFIGVAADGKSPLGNGHGLQRDGTFTLATGYVIRGGGVGVAISEGAGKNQIGGTGDGEANIIAHNHGCGVKVVHTSLGNTIRGNAIFQNRDLGISLLAENESDIAITPNDDMDEDTGPNRLQNRPEFTVLPRTSGTVLGTIEIQGTLQSTPNTRFHIDFYLCRENAEGGLGQGEEFSQTISVSTDALGVATFDAVVKTRSTSSVSSRRYLTATATDTSSGDTSEFSRAMPLPKDENQTAT